MENRLVAAVGQGMGVAQGSSFLHSDGTAKYADFDGGYTDK